ncbi:hypothetical protein [Haloferula sp.]|uniref:hypothetical protein n=1 Tax=Haloferula sp. TaxID=2497595 RepID=UPI003C72D656
MLPQLRAQEATVSMRIDLVAWGDEIPGLSINTGKSKGKLTALAFRYSTPMSYSGPAIMEIHQSSSGGNRRISEPSAEEKEHELQPLVPEKSEFTYETKPRKGLALELEKRREKDTSLVALAALPASGCRRATVLLAPAGEGTYTAYVIDDDPSQLPLGQLRIHNLSPATIAVRCNGNQAKELKPRETHVVSPKNGQLVYELAYRKGDEWMMQENNIIPVRETEQTQMIVLKSDNQFFLSTDGSSGGFLQIVTLRRSQSQE